MTVASGSTKTYALISHESAIEAIWALAARDWQGVLDDEYIWLVPAPESCITNQAGAKELSREVDLVSLGIMRRPINILVPDKSCYSRGKTAAFHVWKQTFPPKSFVRIHDRVFVSTPYFAVLQLAMSTRPSRLSTFEAELAQAEIARMRGELGLSTQHVSRDGILRWESIRRLVCATRALCDFMSTYRYLPRQSSDNVAPASGLVYQKQPIITAKAFHAYLQDLRGIRGVTHAQRVADLSLPHSGSPMETMLALILTLPTDLGGFGLPKPLLNHPIPIQACEMALVSQETMLADLCWPDHRLILEYQGWGEHYCAGRNKVASDLARSNSLTALGWSVTYATFDHVSTVSGISLLARQLASMLDMELSQPTDLELLYRARLLAELLPTQVS